MIYADVEGVVASCPPLCPRAPITGRPWTSVSDERGDAEGLSGKAQVARPVASTHEPGATPAIPAVRVVLCDRGQHW